MNPSKPTCGRNAPGMLNQTLMTDQMELIGNFKIDMGVGYEIGLWRKKKKKTATG
jgi:hypothetical protein